MSNDPEGEEIFDSLCACRNERILILTSGNDTALVNALQARADVVLQNLCVKASDSRWPTQCGNAHR
jgi:hypothetical protein